MRCLVSPQTQHDLTSAFEGILKALIVCFSCGKKWRQHTKPLNQGGVSLCGAQCRFGGGLFTNLNLNEYRCIMEYALLKIDQIMLWQQTISNLGDLKQKTYFSFTEHIHDSQLGPVFHFFIIGSGLKEQLLCRTLPVVLGEEKTTVANHD